MVKPSLDAKTGDVMPDFGIYGGTQENIADEYKKYRTPDCEMDALYIVKANAVINTEAHANVQSNLASGKIKLLIDEKEAKLKLLGTKVG